MGKIIIRNSIH